MGDVLDMRGNVILKSKHKEPVADADRRLIQPHGEIFEKLDQFSLTVNCESNLIQHFRDKGRLNSYVAACINRFAECDYGTLALNEVKENKKSLAKGEMVIGVYPFDENPKDNDPQRRTFLILDAGHANLTMLMPEDY
tara:strand:- start:1491 stop:1904 length:414 start_codon:yes stop_codon:yes gene_type:complete